MRTNDLRKMRRADSWFCDEDTEQPYKVDRDRLNLCARPSSVFVQYAWRRIEGAISLESRIFPSRHRRERLAQEFGGGALTLDERTIPVVLSWLV